MKLLHLVQNFVSKVRESYLPASYSYEILDSDFEDKYLLSMQFINNADMNFLSAIQYYENHEELERGEFEDYFRAFSEYKFELFQVIKEKDSNTSWLSSKMDQLSKAKREVEALLDSLKEQEEALRSK